VYVLSSVKNATVQLTCTHKHTLKQQHTNVRVSVHSTVSAVRFIAQLHVWNDSACFFEQCFLLFEKRLLIFHTMMRMRMSDKDVVS